METEEGSLFPTSHAHRKKNNVTVTEHAFDPPSPVAAVKTAMIIFFATEILSPVHVSCFR